MQTLRLCVILSTRDDDSFNGVNVHEITILQPEFQYLTIFTTRCQFFTIR